MAPHSQPERQFAYGRDEASDGITVATCPVVAVGEEREAGGVIDRLAEQFDYAVWNMDGTTAYGAGVIDEPTAKEAWEQVIDEYEPDTHMRNVAVRIARELGWR